MWTDLGLLLVWLRSVGQRLRWTYMQSCPKVSGGHMGGGGEVDRVADSEANGGMPAA